ncbi:MAG: hypothetical protein L0331_11455 [Chloroflexi bacterium]|nr:hypothetical protein [Chloroflexota bacterium]
MSIRKQFTVKKSFVLALLVVFVSIVSPRLSGVERGLQPVEPNLISSTVRPYDTQQFDDMEQKDSWLNTFPTGTDEIARVERGLQPYLPSLVALQPYGPQQLPSVQGGGATSNLTPI